MKIFYKKILILVFFLIFPTRTALIFRPKMAVADATPIYEYNSIFHPVIATQEMVASQEDLGTKAGLKVLQEGGNAIDAAVTVGFTLAVTLPRAGNIGGGGFMLVYLADEERVIGLDYREKAPLAATSDMFLDRKGEVNQEKARFSHLAVGVPGTVAGLITALEKSGTISLERALQPAIELAEKGFIVDEDLYNSLQGFEQQLRKNRESQQIFFKPNGQSYRIGDRFIQKDLARSLRLIAKGGKKAFYEGKIADSLVADMKRNGGLITREDLKRYQPQIREPVRGTYRGYEVYSMAPPSSGGVHLIQILNILENFSLDKLGHNTANTIHLMAEAMKFAYGDRFLYMGDPDFVKIPVARLISKSYAKEISQKIDLHKVIPSSQILEQLPKDDRESVETTHYSIVDKYGNAVSNTYTLNFSYGSGITVPGTGILLNNEMDDFTAKVGEQNAHGLKEGQANSIEPEKRMISSMTPTIVTKDDKLFLVTGSPGGSRIITTTLQVILNAIDHKMNIAEATNAPRVHHQWFPDQLFVEKALNRDTVDLLKMQGYQVIESPAMGSTQSIMIQNGKLYGASDPRRPGAFTQGN